jgi:hypothetical protein
MPRLRMVLIVIGLVLFCQAAAQRRVMGQSGKRFEIQRQMRLTEILKRHAAWLKDGGFSKSFRLANDPRRADLRGADLMFLHLEGVHLEGANLEGVNLEGASLLGAHLYATNLEGANLEGAHLEDANLVGAYLTGANLSYAHLDHTNLMGAQWRARTCTLPIWTSRT